MFDRLRGLLARSPRPWQLPASLPVLPLPRGALMPGVTLPLRAERADLLSLVYEARRRGGVVVAGQHRPAETPGARDVFDVGVLARVARLKRTRDGDLDFELTGVLRCRLAWVLSRGPWLHARWTHLPTTGTEALAERGELLERFHAAARAYVHHQAAWPGHVRQWVTTHADVAQVADFLAGYVEATQDERQRALEALDLGERLEWVLALLRRATPSTPALRLVGGPRP